MFSPSAKELEIVVVQAFKKRGQSKKARTSPFNNYFFDGTIGAPAGMGKRK
jgi:hypothetical protein